MSDSPQADGFPLTDTQLAEIEALARDVYEGVEDCCTIATVDDPALSRWCDSDGCSGVLPLARAIDALLAEVRRCREREAEMREALLAQATLFDAEGNKIARHFAALLRALAATCRPTRRG